MTCRYKKSGALTSLSKRVVWVSSEEAPLCESKTVICGAVGSQASPVPFSRLFDLLRSLVSVTNDIQIHFNTGAYMIPGPIPTSPDPRGVRKTRDALQMGPSLQEIFVCPGFQTVILSGDHPLLTELHGTWDFSAVKDTIVLQNLSLHAPDGRAAIQASGNVLELSDVRVFGNTDEALLSLTNQKGYKIFNIEFFQEGMGWCIAEFSDSARSDKPVRATVENVSLESAGGFYKTTNRHSGKQITNFLNIAGSANLGFLILNSSGNLSFNINNMQMQTFGDNYVLEIEAGSEGDTKWTHRGGSVEAEKGGFCQMRIKDRSRVALDLSDVNVECAKTFRFLEGSEESKMEEIILDSNILQLKDAEVPLLVYDVKDFHIYNCKYTNCKFQSESNVPLEISKASGNSRINYVGFGNEFINLGWGGVFKTEIKDQAKIALDCNSEKAEGFGGIVEDVITNDGSVFEISRSSYNVSTTEGSLNFFTGSGQSHISNKMNNVTQNAGPDPHHQRPCVNRLDVCGSSEYVMTGNGIYKNFELRENEIGTLNITRDRAKVAKTRLNEIINLGKGTVFETLTHNDSQFLSNISNFQGQAGVCFNGKTFDRSTLVSQKANLILQTGSLVKREHNSTQPMEEILTVSGANRNNPLSPLYDVSSQNENHGPANLRVTNSVFRCQSDDPDTPPVIIVNGCKTGDQICALQLSLTNARVSTQRCKVLNGVKALINFVSSEAVTANGDQLFDLRDAQCDSRASSIVGPTATAFNSKDCDLSFNATSINAGKFCANNEQSKTLIATCKVSVPEGKSCVDGGIVAQSTSSCWTGSNTVNAILEELPALASRI